MVKTISDEYLSKGALGTWRLWDHSAVEHGVGNDSKGEPKRANKQTNLEEVHVG